MYIYIYTYIHREFEQNSSEQDIAKLLDLRTTSYLSKNCLLKPPQEGRKNENFKNYAFITTPKHICNELIKLNGMIFQDVRLNVQEARRSNTNFNESRKITEPFFEGNVKSGADSIVVYYGAT